VTASKRRKTSKRKPLFRPISPALGKIPSLDSLCNRSARSPIVKLKSPPPLSFQNPYYSAPESNNSHTLSMYASNPNHFLSAHKSASLSAPELAVQSMTASASQSASKLAPQSASELAPQSITASASQLTNVSASHSQALVSESYHHEYSYQRDKPDRIIEQSADRLLVCGSLTEFLRQEKDT